MYKIAAIIVAFGKPQSLIRCIDSLRAQTYTLSHIYVVDNTPDNSVKDEIKTHINNGLIYSHHPENLGAEGGFAAGIQLAYETHDALLLFDDDSYVEPKVLSNLLERYDVIKSSAKIGALRCARPWDKKPGSYEKEILDLYAWKGSLIFSDAVKNIGLPVAEFFLYGGDAEYGHRMRKNEYKIYLIFSAVIESVEYTDMINLKFFTMQKQMYTSPTRIYYSFRNEVYTWIQHKIWDRIFRFILYSSYCAFVSALYKRFDLSRAVISGVWDGLRKKLGKNKLYTPVPE